MNGRLVEIRRQRAKNTPKQLQIFPASIYLLQVNNKNTRAKCEICSELTQYV